MNKLRVIVTLKTGERYEHTGITETYASEGGFYCLYEEVNKQLYRYPSNDIRVIIEKVDEEDNEADA